jgi:hypothetical protein
MVERHPMKNYLKPEVAEMADFLISEKAKSISGQVLKWIMVSFHLSFKNKNITESNDSQTEVTKKSNNMTKS